MHKTNSMTTPGGNTSSSVNPPSSEAGPKDSGGDHSLLYDNKNPDPSTDQDTTISNDPDLTFHHKKKALIQQTLHRTFFPSRSRANSCSEISTANQGSAIASKLELPPTRDFRGVSRFDTARLDTANHINRCLG